MSAALIVRRTHPGITVQDMGRPGFLSFGLSRGGACDPLALWEGAALLSQSHDCAALELAGAGGVFDVTQDVRIALTGAPMQAEIEGGQLQWNASHLLPKGARLTIGAARAGCYGYLHVGGGLRRGGILRSQSTHVAAGVGAVLHVGDHLPLGPDGGGPTGQYLPIDTRFDGGALRIVPSLQTAFFSDRELNRFEASIFTRDAKGNRMGVRIMPDGDGFRSEAGLSVVSEVIVPGDVQITGDGTPFVLLSECQTTGGYPRIGTVLPADIPRIAQAAPGARLRFRFVTLDDAVEIERSEAIRRTALRRAVRPLVRDPRNMSDLLAYQLISGVTAGEDLEG